MEQVKETAVSAGLKAPRAGAIAGIVFSILLIISLVLIRLSIPDSPGDPGTWLSHSVKPIRLALDLLPSPELPSCGSWVCCATGWEQTKTASLPLFSTAAGSCFSQ